MVEAERVAVKAERVEVEAKRVEVDGGCAAGVSVVCERRMRLQRDEIVEARSLGSERRKTATTA